ncbi:hypothetical protein JW364_19055 [Gordonia sp. BP-119]|nr:hypothetical protein [Gordonia sp. BP-119]
MGASRGAHALVVGAAADAESISTDVEATAGGLEAQCGYLAYPDSDEIVTPDGKGRFNSFQNGSFTPQLAHILSTNLLWTFGRMLDMKPESGVSPSPHRSSTASTTRSLGSSPKCSAIRGSAVDRP